MGVFEKDIYADGMTNLCLSCYPALAIMYYELYLLIGYL